MDKRNFPNPKLNLPKELRVSELESGDELFTSIENYLDLICAFIYTDIDMAHDPSDASHKHAWVLKVVSANLIRSLYLRNAVVEAINTRNVFAFYLALKAWFEVVGVLASILNLLEQKTDVTEFSDDFVAYALGNRGKGGLRVGEIEAKNVATMIEKADKLLNKMALELGEESGSKTFFTDFYDIASNASHPCFDAYQLVGDLDQNNYWKAYSPDVYKRHFVEARDGYGGLLMSPLLVVRISTQIFEICKEGFEKIGAKKYFD